MSREDISRIVFRGSNPDECEDFISAIRGRALAEGKHRDNQWIAYFASSCFVGDALYWYEGLDESIQEDWKLLRPAILERFGRKSQHPASPPSSAMVPTSAMAPTSAVATAIPTPAAAPPGPRGPISSSVSRKGRLKVLSRYGISRGYIGTVVNSFGVYNHVEEALRNALLVELIPSSTHEGHEIRLPKDRLQDEEDFLAVTWLNTRDSSWVKGSRSNAACCSWNKTTTNTRWQTSKRVWIVLGDNEVRVEYPSPNGGNETLRPCIDYGDGFLRWLGNSNEGVGYEQMKVTFEEAV